ncbi:MAG: aldehyde dehydrogenase family protein [Planctomycetota bacterium]|nr:aldehyde dehydrogenase family protein [Planctomycetota bacterium]
MKKRAETLKTWKLFIGGAFPRSESGRTVELRSTQGKLIAHLCDASRKDFREAVESARVAQVGWSAATPYLRGQVLYRFAEMIESRRMEFVDARQLLGTSARVAKQDVECGIDRLISLAGWSDKAAMILGSQNPVSGPFYNFSAVEPAGVVVAIPSIDAPLSSTLSLIGGALAVGNSIILVAHPECAVQPLLLAEVCACSDIPAGVVNVLTTDPSSLAKTAAEHRDVRVIAAFASGRVRHTLRAGAAENLKRVSVWPPQSDLSTDYWGSPTFLASFTELKTVWMPRSL